MNWKSTKFAQAVFVQITGAVALFTGKIDGGTYVALSTIALGIYATADVADKRLNNA
jgi:hypothetical protein